MTKTIHILNCIYFVGYAFYGVGCELFTRQGVIHELLMKNSTDKPRYDSKIAPNFEDDIPTEVTIQLFVQNIYSVSESSMDFSVDLMLKQKWNDSRLAYHNMSGLRFIELDNKLMDSVWVPDTYFFNEKKASVHMVTQPNKMMHLYKNGTVLYSMRLSLTLSCPMNLRKYPLDEQKCPIVMQSYAYTKGNVMFKWEKQNALAIQQSVIMPQFEPFVGLTFETCNHISRDFSCLQTEILLKRKVGYYIVQVFVPSILIVVLSWVSFWVDHDAVPARISLGVLTVLTMTTQSSGARQSLPQVSYIKAIDVWMFTCLLFVFVSLLEYSYVNVVARRQKKCKRKRPQESVELQTVVVSPKENILDKETGALLVEEESKCYCWLDARQVDKVSRRLFPALFSTFNVIFWVFYFLYPDPEPE